MIERHYGKYIPDRGLDPAIIEALEARNEAALRMRGGGLEPGEGFSG